MSGVTNDDGMRSAPNVPVGEYDVTIVSPGFSGAQQSVTVTSGNVQEVHFALAVAQHQETVEVSGAPETVNPSSSRRRRWSAAATSRKHRALTGRTPWL